jgi:hypothetical protein
MTIEIFFIRPEEDPVIEEKQPVFGGETVVQT